MDKDIIEQYKTQMRRMYESKLKPTMAETPVTQEPTPLPPNTDSTTGKLIGIITNVRGLYFVPNAKVSVFTGTVDNMNIIDTSVTDQNGKTKDFLLPTPSKALSMDPQNTKPVYSLYNMLVEADGFLTNIHLNIPVFPDTVSRQSSNLLLLETAGVNKGPRIFDELESYNL